jgi:hypothetical protein
MVCVAGDRCEWPERCLRADSFGHAEKGALLAEVLQENIDREIPRLFDELRREARPRYHVLLPEPVARLKPVPATTSK